MATAKQAAASRANPSESTGPRTSQGQTASRFNALKHGICAQHQIMFDESAEDLAEYHEHHRPADPGQRLLVDPLFATNGVSAACAASKPFFGSTPPTPSLPNIQKRRPVIPLTPSPPTPATSSASGAGPWPAYSATRGRVRCHPAIPAIPATPTIHSQIREFGFVQSKSETPAPAAPVAPPTPPLAAPASPAKTWGKGPQIPSQLRRKQLRPLCTPFSRNPQPISNSIQRPATPDVSQCRVTRTKAAPPLEAIGQYGVIGDMRSVIYY